MPGQSVTATLRIERNGFDDEVKFEVNNLPHGVIVDNIGLSGVLIRKGQNEREIFFNAREWVPETSRYCHALATNAEGVASQAILLHVRQRETLAKASESQ